MMAHWKAQRLLSVYLWLYSCLDQILDTSKTELIPFTFYCFFLSFLFSFFSFMFFLNCCSPSRSGCTQSLIFGFIGVSLKHLVGQSYIFCPLPELNATQTQAESLCWHLQKEFHREFCGFFLRADSAFFLQTYNMCFHCSHINLWICWCHFLFF